MGAKRIMCRSIGVIRCCRGSRGGEGWACMGREAGIYETRGVGTGRWIR